MGAKATFNAATRMIKLTEAPAIVNGELSASIDVAKHLYSDMIDDWIADESLRRLKAPIRAVGGDAKPGGDFLGSSFFLASDWKVELYDASHNLTVNGNFYSEDGKNPFIKPAGGTFNTFVFQNLSNIIDKVSAGSGLDAGQDAKLTNIDALITQIQVLTDELHKIKGLDKDNPLTVSQDRMKAGSIDIKITGNGKTAGKAERQ